jgi:hypothetical protein
MVTVQSSPAHCLDLVHRLPMSKVFFIKKKDRL